MLSLPPAVRIYVCTRPADMRRSFDGLAGCVRDWLGADPLSGHLFVFRNRSADRLKVLFWDDDGLVIYYKRLEEGTFRLPPPPREGEALLLRPSELAMLLDGVDLTSVRRLKRYRRPETVSQ